MNQTTNTTVDAQALDLRGFLPMRERALELIDGVRAGEPGAMRDARALLAEESERLDRLVDALGALGGDLATDDAAVELIARIGTGQLGPILDGQS